MGIGGEYTSRLNYCEAQKLLLQSQSNNAVEFNIFSNARTFGKNNTL